LRIECDDFVFGYGTVEVVASDDGYATYECLADALGKSGFSRATGAIDANDKSSARATLIQQRGCRANRLFGSHVLTLLMPMYGRSGG